MVILIVGNGETEKALQEKFTAEGHRVLRAGDAEEITELLLPGEKLDMLVLGRIMLSGEDSSVSHRGRTGGGRSCCMRKMRRSRCVRCRRPSPAWNGGR